MVQEVTKFSRFYTIFNKLPYGGDREEFKRSIVMQFTWNRTSSLREMTSREYTACCQAMEKMAGKDEKAERDALRRSRSVCLHLMQRIGVDTADWSAVNRFCLSPKIAGYEFRELDTADLADLSRKLRMILKKQTNKNEQDGRKEECGHQVHE